jgi:SAM-dependent methyltransferase
LSKTDGYHTSASFYDLFPQTGDLEFYGRHALQRGRAIDIGAGTGRLAIPLAEREVELACVEPSGAMLAEFRQKLKDRPELASRITLVGADAASFRLHRTFPAAFMAGSFDHLLSDEERLAALTNIARHLEPGANFILDSYWGLMTDSPLKHTDEVEVEGKLYRRLVGRQVRPDNTVKITLVFEIYNGDQLEDRFEQFSQAGIIDRKRIHELLGETGFQIVAEYRDYSFSPYREGDELLLMETERKGK